MWFLEISLCRVIRIPDVIIRAGTRLLVVCGENIDGRGVGGRAQLSLHIPQTKVVEDLFMKIFVGYSYSGVILLIFEPCRPRPPINPFWSKKKA